MPALQDIENEVLLCLQQPGTHFGGAPTWSSLTNPQLAQSSVDYYINKGYYQTLGDLNEYLCGQTIMAYMPSIAFVGQIPTSGALSGPAAPSGVAQIPPLTPSVSATITQAVAIAPAFQTVTVSNLTNIVQAEPLVVNAGLADQEIVVVSLVNVTTPSFSAYFMNSHLTAATLTGVSYPVISQVRETYYGPQGLGYFQRYMPGGDLISNDQFNIYTEQGFLVPFSSATQPGKMSVSNDRKFLRWFPSSAFAGDLVGVQYNPLPTAGATLCPTLVNETDVPLLNEDCHDAILFYALGFLFLRERQVGMAKTYYNPDPRAPGMYQQKIEWIKDKYRKTSFGDYQRMMPRGGSDSRGISLLGSGSAGGVAASVG